MKKFAAATSFEKEFLNSLVADENSCVVLEEHQYHLALHPYHLNNIKESIKDLLGPGIARFDKKLNEILLGYENIKLLNEAAIMDDSFFVHIDVSANFFLFKPEVGKTLVGYVNKKSEDHVGCLVYDTFNVSLPKPENEDIESWFGSHVQIGYEIAFKITHLKLHTRLPYIRGEIILNKSNEVLDDSTPKRKKKKKKTKEDAETNVEVMDVVPKRSKKIRQVVELELTQDTYSNGITDDFNTTTPLKHKRKKSKTPDQIKKELHNEEIVELMQDTYCNGITDDFTTTPIKHKKKKSKTQDQIKKKLRNEEIVEQVTLKEFKKNKRKRETEDEISHSTSEHVKSNSSVEVIEDITPQHIKKKRKVELCNGEYAQDITQKKVKKKKNKDIKIELFC